MIDLVKQNRLHVDNAGTLSSAACNSQHTSVLQIIKPQEAIDLAAVELDFTINSSGFGTSRFVKWFDHKYGKEVDMKAWVKAHLGCALRQT